ncbi:cold shock domain-containing protein [Candidatus Nitrospira bockiana]
MDLQIETRNTDLSPAWREEIESRVEDLRAGRDDLTHVRVTLKKNRHKTTEEDAEVLIVAQIPGRTLTARKTENTFEEALRVTFETLRLELEKHRDKIGSHEVRLPPIPARGVIARVFRDEGYGFILKEDGEEVYFHRNAVHDMEFDALEEGTEVTFNVELGLKGPQATTVNPPPPPMIERYEHKAS